MSKGKSSEQKIFSRCFSEKKLVKGEKISWIFRKIDGKLEVNRFAIAIPLQCRGIPQKFRLSKISSKISYIKWTNLEDILCILLFAKGVRQFCEMKEHSVRKLSNKSCSTFPLNLGIYYSRAFWACNKHFNKDLFEAFKALKCFKYMLPQNLFFFPKNPSHIKDFVYQCGIGQF